MTGKGMDEELTLPDNATCANVNGRPTALAEGKVGCSRPFQLRESCIVVADRVDEFFMDIERGNCVSPFHHSLLSISPLFQERHSDSSSKMRHSQRENRIFERIKLLIRGTVDSRRPGMHPFYHSALIFPLRYVNEHQPWHRSCLIKFFVDSD